MFQKYFSILDVLYALFDYVKENEENTDFHYLYIEVEKLDIHHTFKTDILRFLKEQIEDFNYKDLIDDIMNAADLYYEYAD